MSGPDTVMDAAGNDGSATRSAAPIAFVIAAAAALLAALLLTDAGTSWRFALALPLVLGGGVAFGPLLLLTPVETSPLKLAVFASLLSPPLAAAVWSAAVFGAGLAPGTAWALVFGLASVLALLAAGKRIGRAPLGRAAWVIIAAGTVAAVLALLATWTTGGLHERLVSPACVAHVTIAETIGRGAPFENPWLAGGALDVRPSTGALLAAVAEPAGLAPLYVLAIVRGWSLLMLALVGYLAAAAAFRERGPRGAAIRDVLAGLLAMASPGLSWGLAWGASAVFHGSLPSGAWLEPDPARMLARVYAFAALLAGLHAVRRGAHPWPMLAALLVAVCALLQPWTGAAVAVALALAAVLARRFNSGPLFLLALLPAFMIGRLHGGFAGEQVERTVRRATEIPWLLLGILAVPALVLIARSRGVVAEGEERRVARRGFALLALAVLLPLAVAVFVPPARGDTAALVAASLLPLVIATAAGLVSIGRPVIGGSIGVLFVAASAVGALRDGIARAEYSAPPVEDRPSGLVLTSSAVLEEDLGAAFEWIRSSALAHRPRTALLRGVASADPRGLPSLAPLLTGVGLWSDVVAPPGSRQNRFGAGFAAASTALGDRWADRIELLSALFLEERAWGPRFDRVLRAEVARGTTLVFVVTEADRRRTTDRGVGPRGADMIVRRLGAEIVFEGEEVVVYALE